MTRVLAIDDDRQLLRALQITLGARGYEWSQRLQVLARWPPPALRRPMW